MLYLSIIQLAIAKNIGSRLELDGEMILISYVYFFFERFSGDFVNNSNFLFHDYIITRKKGFVNPYLFEIHLITGSPWYPDSNMYQA